MFGTLLDSAAPSDPKGAVQGPPVEHSGICGFGDKGFYRERASKHEETALTEP